MSKLAVGPVGVTLNVSADGAYLDEAAELEQLGYSAIWLPGGQIDSLDRIAAIVRATTAISVGSAIISPDVYDAAAVAALYADLQETASDRFIVGLGGPQQPPSMRALHDYLDRLDGAEHPLAAQRRILAALGPRKLEVARDRCAGAIALLVTPSYTAAARRTLGADSTLVIDQMVVLDTDGARARETARGPLRFLSAVGGYVANFARMGFTPIDISDLSDRLVDELIVWGDADTITERVNEPSARARITSCSASPTMPTSRAQSKWHDTSPTAFSPDGIPRRDPEDDRSPARPSPSCRGARPAACADVIGLTFPLGATFTVWVEVRTCGSANSQNVLGCRPRPFAITRS